MVLNSPNVCVMLQEAPLDGVAKWRSNNEMAVYPVKPNLVRYSRRGNFLEADYFLEGSLVQRCCLIRYFGVLIDSSFQIGSHINQACTRAARTLGPVVRPVNHGLGIKSAVMLLKALVRQQLAYASVVWFPHHCGEINYLQSLQVPGAPGRLWLATLMSWLQISRKYTPSVPLQEEERSLTCPSSISSLIYSEELSLFFVQKSCFLNFLSIR